MQFFAYSPFGLYHNYQEQLLNSPALLKVTAAHQGFTKYQVAVRWLVQHGVPTTVWSSDLSDGGHLAQMIDMTMTKLVLSDAEMSLLDASTFHL